MSDLQSAKRRANAPARDDTQAAVTVLMRVHLWSGIGERKSPVPPLAVAMVEDLLSISRCDLRKGSGGAVDSIFADTPEAVHAARRIGLLLRGFCSASEAGFVDGCMTLSSAAESSPSLDIPLLLRTRILEPALPGQVLVVGTLCGAARQIPGLRFNELSGGVARLPQGGIADTVLHLMPPIGMEETDASPIKFRPAGPKPQPLVRSAPTIVEQVAMPAGKAAKQTVRIPISTPPVSMPKTGSKSANTAAAKSPSGPSLLSQMKTASQRLLAQGRQVGGRKTRITAFAAVAVLIVSVAIYVGYPRIFANSAVATTSPKSQDASSAPGATIQESPESHPADSGIHPKTQNTASMTPGRSKKPDAHSTVAEQEDGDAVDPGIKNPAGKGSVAFNASELSALLAKAEQESADGQYDAAISDFQIVLNHDPRNARAKQGLERARKNKDN